MNLCVNARDAMPGGGSITVQVRADSLDEAEAAERGLEQAGPHVRVSVRDTGTGMDPETLSRVFEPFFTTKEMGSGTGLGLATVYGIVRQHGGSITAVSRVGEGSEFIVHLPMAESRPSPQPLERGVEPVPRGTETILLAEDDSAVRQLTTRILERAGHRVIAAKDGEGAVSLFEQHRGEIDLLLFDVVMPGMGGRTAFERIREMDPDIPCLFASGYSVDALHTDFVLEEGMNLIPKPFEAAALIRRIRSLLDA
jgi:CheY-like chemotaxis protein